MSNFAHHSFLSGAQESCWTWLDMHASFHLKQLTKKKRTVFCVSLVIVDQNCVSELVLVRLEKAAEQVNVCRFGDAEYALVVDANHSHVIAAVSVVVRQFREVRSCFDAGIAPNIGEEKKRMRVRGPVSKAQGRKKVSIPCMKLQHKRGHHTTHHTPQKKRRGGNAH